MDFVFSILIVIAILKGSEKFSNRFPFNRYFISIPYIASCFVLILTFCIDYISAYLVEFNYLSSRLFVTVFLFTIGFQIASVYKKLHWKRMGILFLICALLIILLKAFSLLFPSNARLIVGPIMLGFNLELLEKVTSVHVMDFLLYWSSIQMGIVFICTPLFLYVLEKILLHKKGPTQVMESERVPIKQPFLNFVVIGISMMIVLAIHVWMKETYFFFFDFVFSMILGYGYGTWINRKRKRLVEEINQHLHHLGTLSLYGFIIISIQSLYYLDWSYFNYHLFFTIMAKTIIIAFASYWVTNFYFKKLPFKDSLVAIIAGWTFTLNAPVVCMHGMRTVVNKYGPSPNVLLIVPPVILWLVNYLQLLLHLILSQ